MRIRIDYRSLQLSAAILLLCFCPLSLFGQAANNERHTRKQPADTLELSAIAERGRAIAAYDQAAWHATDAVQALNPEKSAVGMYIGRHTNAGWVMAFGKLNEAKDTFLLAYEATPTADPLHPVVVFNNPAKEDRSEWFHMARAIDITRSSFDSHGRPYNDAVLHASGDAWYVYFYPGTTSNDVFPTGADVRFRVSGDGTRIEETHTMHATYLEFKIDPKEQAKMTFRTAFLDDAPEDTDVANAIMMGGVRGFIAAPTFTYAISEDGTPTYLQTTKAFMKEMKKK